MPRSTTRRMSVNLMRWCGKRWTAAERSARGNAGVGRKQKTTASSNVPNPAISSTATEVREGTSDDLESLVGLVSRIEKSLGLLFGPRSRVSVLSLGSRDFLSLEHH